MLHSLRTHHVAPGKMAEFHELRREAIPFFEKHGIKVVGYWKTEIGPSPCVVSMTAFEDWAQYERAQSSLVADPEFKKLMSRFQGLSLRTDTVILRPTDYSPMQ
jgi:hypothetical protein